MTTIKKFFPEEKKTVLVLGAGLVTRPLVHYLSENNFNVILGSRTLKNAEKICQGAKNSHPLQLNVENEEDFLQIRNLISSPEVHAVVSMLPYLFHAKVCEVAVEFKKHFLTTSYVSVKMRELEKKAAEAGIIIVNECGVDPGTDHMSAQKLIDHVHKNEGKVLSFQSYCGGLPAPEDNNNPLGYKFSWAPRGVLLASKNSALFLKDGKEVTISSADLFSSYEIFKVEGLEGELEGYPNRDSIQYLDVYQLKGECKSIIRGTYRNRGWCDLVKKISDLGYLDLTEKNLSGFTYAKLTSSLLKNPGAENLTIAVAAQLGLDVNHKIISTLNWLGLFGDEAIPPNTNTPLDALCAAMLARMQYAEGERDMLVMLHTFVCEFPKEGKRRIYTCRLLDFGIKNGDSSMSRTVSLPVAIATKLVLDGKLDHLKGRLVIPTLPELYNPILEELEKMGIVFKEKLEKEEPL